MKIEDSSMIYYMDSQNVVQDGNQWLDDYKHGELDLHQLKQLKECYWSSIYQKWMLEEKRPRD